MKVKVYPAHEGPAMDFEPDAVELVTSGAQLTTALVATPGKVVLKRLVINSEAVTALLIDTTADEKR